MHSLSCGEVRSASDGQCKTFFRELRNEANLRLGSRFSFHADGLRRPRRRCIPHRDQPELSDRASGDEKLQRLRQFYALSRSRGEIPSWVRPNPGEQERSGADKVAVAVIKAP